MAYGITDQGFFRPRLTDIKAQIESTLIATFGATIDLSPSSVFGQLVGIFAEREDLVWQGLEDVYNSEYPDTAFGVSLDNVGAISGIPRLGAMPSKVLSFRIFGTAGTLIPQGTQFSVENSPTSVFATDNDITLVAGANEVQDIDFSAVPTSGAWKLNWNGQDTTSFAFNANAATLQAAIRALPFGDDATVTGNYTSGFTVTFTGASGKQEWPLIVVASNTLVNGITPVNVTIVETTPGVNQGTVNMTATSNGPILANAGTLNVIVTPVSGMSSGLNITDAVVGRNAETDNEYRARRAETLQVAGAGTVEAIRSKLLALDGVTAAIVFENTTDIDDIDGRPPHSFEAVVQGAEDQAIADLIWSVKPAGIASDGTTVVQITDSQGQVHDIRFSRPTTVPIYVELDLTTNDDFPANGVAAVKQAIVDSGDALGIGKTVVVIPYLISAIASIPGIDDAVIRVGTAPSPTLDNNIPIAANEVSDFDTSRVSVTLL